jgi:Holliday junction DNA helicase RuvA
MFELLLQVSGIGAKSAIIMLSNITPSNFVLAVITNDVSKLTKIPGIGAKTAQRIILELKDKLKTEAAVSKTEETRSVLEKSEVIDEAISALQILGYNKKEIEKALEKIDKTNITVEELIKKGLTILSIK